jgi:hypothetical protein
MKRRLLLLVGCVASLNITRRIAIIHAKPKNATTSKTTPETCGKVCNHPIIKPYTKARNVNPTNGFTTHLLSLFRTLFEKTATKNAKEIIEVKIAIPKTDPLICPLDHSDKAKLKYRVPKDTGLTSFVTIFTFLIRSPSGTDCSLLHRFMSIQAVGCDIMSAK